MLELVTPTPTQRAYSQAKKERLARIANAAKRIEIKQAGPIVEAVKVKHSHPDDVFGPQVYASTGLRPNIKAIQMAVANFYRITIGELIAHNRTEPTCTRRQIAMWLCLKLALRPSTVIGEKFLNRDHTTVLSAVKKIDAEMAKMHWVAEDIVSIKKQLVSEGYYVE